MNIVKFNLVFLVISFCFFLMAIIFSGCAGMEKKSRDSGLFRTVDIEPMDLN